LIAAERNPVTPKATAGAALDTFENQVSAFHKSGAVSGLNHLCAGQNAKSAGPRLALERDRFKCDHALAFLLRAIHALGSLS
jgi:hypothetical protein